MPNALETSAAGRHAGALLLLGATDLLPVSDLLLVLVPLPHAQRAAAMSASIVDGIILYIIRI